LKSESFQLLAILEKLNVEISGFGIVFTEEKNLKKLARMIFSEPIYEKNFFEHFADSN
jgi:hypothetical protein